MGRCKIEIKSVGGVALRTLSNNVWFRFSNSGALYHVAFNDDEKRILHAVEFINDSSQIKIYDFPYSIHGDQKVIIMDVDLSVVAKEKS